MLVNGAKFALYLTDVKKIYCYQNINKYNTAYK